MHILLIVHDFLPGGAERIAIRLATRWARLGNRITIMCGRRDGPLLKLVDPSIEIICEQFDRSTFSRFRLGSRVAAKYEELRPDVIFLPANYYFDAAVALRTLLPRSGVRIVGKLSNALARPGKGCVQQSAYNRALYLKMLCLDHVVAISDGLAREARNALPRWTPMSTIRQPVFDSAHEEMGVASEPIDDGPPPRFVAAGRLAPQKNFEMLLNAVASITSQRLFHVDIYGDGPLRDTLLARIEELGLQGVVRLRGYVEQLLPHIRGADGFVLSSDFEGFPSVIIEALRAGVPVITTNCSPAIADIFVEDHGSVITGPRDSFALATAMLSFLARDRPDMKSAAAFAASFNLDASAVAYLTLFSSLCGC